MGMKFLNKKGWHTGSLRNIENVWKAEQKQEAEQKKLEELRLQIVQERERSEFRALQEQAGLVPRQERLDFLYDSGLAVGKGSASSSGHGVSFQKEEQPLGAEAGNNASEKPDQSVPGALFEEKAQSANDSWRKLHSDPLLLIRQREQEALAKIKNNPVKMALIRKSVEEKGKGKSGDKEHKNKHKRKSGKHHKKSSSRHRSDSEEESGEESNRRKSHHHNISATYDKHHERPRSDVDDESKGRQNRDKHYERRRSELHDEPKRRESHDKHYERRRSDLDDEPKRRESHDKHYEKRKSDLDNEPKRRESHDKHYERRRSDLDDEPKRNESHDKHYEKRKSDLDNEPKRRESHDKHYERRRSDLDDESRRTEGHDKRRRPDLYDESKEREGHRETRPSEKHLNHSPNNRLEGGNLKSYGQEERKRKTGDYPSRENGHQNRRRKGGSKLSEEERAARLKQMQMDAEVHEEQRWTRIKKADETDAVEADKNKVTTGKSFLDDANKSVYGIEKGGSSTIEESVRRRSYYSQRGTAAEGNAFRR